MINDEPSVVLDRLQIFFQQFGQIAAFESQRFFNDVANKRQSYIQGALDLMQMREQRGVIWKKKSKLFLPSFD